MASRPPGADHPGALGDRRDQSGHAAAGQRRLPPWEVAGAAHSGWEGQEYRRPLQIRDLGAAPVYNCTNPPWSRVLLSQPIEVAYGHLARWVDGGAPPPHAPYLEFTGTTKVRNSSGSRKAASSCRRSRCRPR